MKSHDDPTIRIHVTIPVFQFNIILLQITRNVQVQRSAEFYTETMIVRVNTTLIVSQRKTLAVAYYSIYIHVPGIGFVKNTIITFIN